MKIPPVIRGIKRWAANVTDILEKIRSEFFFDFRSEKIKAEETDKTRDTESTVTVNARILSLDWIFSRTSVVTR
jgi:hypothetical protein